MFKHVMKLVVSIIFINAFAGCQTSQTTGQLPRSNLPAKSHPVNPFTPNSAIFKIPVFKTVNLDFRNAEDTKIQSELLKVLKGLLQNKSMKQEKLILNIKPPKNSNSTFAKNFTTLLRNETNHLDPGATIGVQSTIFKKKSGEISTLRLTLYIIRPEKPVLTHKPLKTASHNNILSKPLTEKANINMTQTENITATIESVLRQLYENSTENGKMQNTDIFLGLLSSTNFSLSQINGLKGSIKQILLQLYPNSTISTRARLLYNRKTHVSKLEFEIGIQPGFSEASLKSTKKELKAAYNVGESSTVSLNLTVISSYYNRTKPAIRSVVVNGTKSVENITKSVQYLLKTVFQNMTGKNVNSTLIHLNISSTKKSSTELNKKIEQSIDKLLHEMFRTLSISIGKHSQYNQDQNESLLSFNISLTPKCQHKKMQESTRQKLNLTLISPKKDSDQLVHNTLRTLQKDLKKLIPDSKLLVQARKVISEDLNLLTKALLPHEEERNKLKISMDLTESGSNFESELDKLLPHILTMVDSSVKPIVVAFRITIPRDYNENSVSSDICFILKTLISKIPAKTRFGDVDLEVTISPHSKEPISRRYSEKSPILADIKAEVLAESSLLPHITNTTLKKLLNLTEPGINLTQRINRTLVELARQLPFNESRLDNYFNFSLTIPQNETDIYVDSILDIMRKDIKILFPYSQILLEAEDMIAEDLHILKLSIGLRPLFNGLEKQEKNTEIIPIDLSELGENIPGELESLLKPLWSNIKEDRPMSFDLKLRPVNDIDRRRLGNDICAIVDILTKSLPQGISFKDIILQTTVLPDEDGRRPERLQSQKRFNAEFSGGSKRKDIPSKLVEQVNTGENMTEKVQSALKELTEGLKHFTGSIIRKQNFSLVVQMPDNETSENVEEIINIIKQDLLELAPYADILIKYQKVIENELRTFDLNINLENKPVKKFEIQLNDLGEFLPEEVDEVVYDIRKSENPFSFALEMVIPDDVDLQAANSEICSVSNVVINNIPKESYLTGTILRVTVSPRTENGIQNQHQPSNEREQNPSPESSEINTFPQDSQSEIQKIDREFIPNASQEEREERFEVPSRNREMNPMQISSNTSKKNKNSNIPSNNKYLTGSSINPLKKSIATSYSQARQIPPSQSPKSYRRRKQPTANLLTSKVIPASELEKDTEGIKEPNMFFKTVPGMISTPENTETIPNYEVNSELPSSSTDDKETSRYITEDLENLQKSENTFSLQEAVTGQPESISLEENTVTDINNEIDDQDILEPGTPQEEERTEGDETEFLPTEKTESKVENISSNIINDQLMPKKNKSIISKGLQDIKDDILKGIDSLSSAVRSLVLGKSTENPSLERISSEDEIEKNGRNTTQYRSMPSTNSYPEDTIDSESSTGAEMPSSMRTQGIKSKTENIPLTNSNPEETDEVEKLLRRRGPHYMSMLRTNSEAENIPSADSYSENTQKLQSPLSNSELHTMPQATADTENIPMINSNAEDTEEARSFPGKSILNYFNKPMGNSYNHEIETILQRRTPFHTIIAQSKSANANIPLTNSYPENTGENLGILGRTIPQSMYTSPIISKTQETIPSANPYPENGAVVGSFLGRRVPQYHLNNPQITKNEYIPNGLSSTSRKKVPLSAPQINSGTERIPFTNSYSVYSQDIRNEFGTVPYSEKTSNIPSANWYPENTDKVKSSFEGIIPNTLKTSQIKVENENFPSTNSYPENIPLFNTFLGKKLPRPVKAPQLKPAENIINKAPINNMRKVISNPQDIEENRPFHKDMNSMTPNLEGNESTTRNSINLIKPLERVTSSIENPKSSENKSEKKNLSDEGISVVGQELKSPSKSVRTRRYRKQNPNTLYNTNNKRKIKTSYNEEDDNDTFSIPRYGEKELETTPIRAFNNDQKDILQYIDDLDLSNSSTNLNETLLTIVTSAVKIIPRNEKETIDMTLNIIPPFNTTVKFLKNITNSVLASLISSLPNDIVNIETNVIKGKNNAVNQMQMKIKISNNEDVIKQMEEKKYLKNKFRDESRMVHNLSEVLDRLLTEIKQEGSIQSYINSRAELEEYIENIEKFSKESLFYVVSDIISTVQNSSQPDLNFTFSLNAPTIVSRNFVVRYRDLLKEILLEALPLKDVAVGANSQTNDTNTVITLIVTLGPRRIFTTSRIDLDALNILDVEVVLSNKISEYISRLSENNVHNKTIIIDFVFETSHISSLNLENIESAIEDVFTSLKLKGELMTEEIKLKLTKKNEIIINLPYIISTLILNERSPPQEESTEENAPEPLDLISDMIPAI